MLFIVTRTFRRCLWSPTDASQSLKKQPSHELEWRCPKELKAQKTRACSSSNKHFSKESRHFFSFPAKFEMISFFLLLSFEANRGSVKSITALFRFGAPQKSPNKKVEQKRSNKNGLTKKVEPRSSYTITLLQGTFHPTGQCLLILHLFATSSDFHF